MAHSEQLYGSHPSFAPFPSPVCNLPVSRFLARRVCVRARRVFDGMQEALEEVVAAVKATINPTCELYIDGGE